MYYFLKKEEIAALQLNENDSKITHKFKCPVYRNSARAGSSNDQAKNYITSIDLDCKENPEFWVLRGICMILENND